MNVSGTVYQSDRATPMGSGRHVNVSVNGAASAGSTTTASDGTYSITGITAASGAVLTLYLQGDSEKAVTLTKSTGSDMAGVDLYQNHLATRSDNASLTGTNVNTADNNGATGISAVYSSSSNTAFTVASGNSLYVPAGQTFAPGASAGFTLSGGDVIIDGTLTLSAAVNIFVTGGFVNNGVYGGSSAFFNMRGSGSHAIKSNGNSLGLLGFQIGTGTYTLQDALTCGAVTFTSAITLDVSASNFAISAGSWANNSGAFVARQGTVTLTASSNTFRNNGGAFYNLSLTPSAARTTTLAADVVVSNNLTISNANATLDVSASNFALAVGGDFANAGTFNARSGTVTLDGTAQTVSGSTTFYDLVANAPGDVLSFTDGTTQTVSNSVTFQNVTLQGTGSSGWTIAVPATQTIDHVTVSRSTATGNTAAAGAGSVDGGNNVNWTFPSAGGGTPCLSSGVLGSRIISPGGVAS